MNYYRGWTKKLRSKLLAVILSNQIVIDIRNSFTGRFLSEFAASHHTLHMLQRCLVQSAVFITHSVYVQLRTLEMQLCRILTGLIVLLCVHDERPVIIMSYWTSLFFSNNNSKLV